MLHDPRIGVFDVRTVLNEPAHVVGEAVGEFSAGRVPDDSPPRSSGHGIKGEGGELYLAAARTEPHRPGSTAVPADLVNRRMTRTRARRVVLPLGCCHAGAFERGMPPARGDTGIDDTGVDIEGQSG